MEPYTAEGMARRDKEALENGNEAETPPPSDGKTNDHSTMEITISITPEARQINYELVGVVVHSGQANAGHYYSFIRERRGTVINNTNKGKWFKFNDTIVEEFEMTDGSVEAECFGGTYKAKVYEQSNSYPEDRLRYWNGYMLFYERMEDAKTTMSAKKSKLVTRKLWPNGVPRTGSDSDSLMELTELVHKGEKKGIFMDKMPASIQRMIHSENLTFVKNRDVYNQEYFKFVKNLVARNSGYEDHKLYNELCVESLKLAVRFLFHTYFRTKKKTKCELDEWVDVIETIISRNKQACYWLLDYMAGEEGRSFVKPFLLECPNKDVRVTFAKIIEKTMCSFLSDHGGVPTYKSLDGILEHLLGMLNREVVDHCKQSVQYFLVLNCFVLMGTKACILMFKQNGFKKLVTFLLGHSGLGHDQETTSRRWSSIQSREFAHLHSTLAILILNCDVTGFRTIETDPGKDLKPSKVSPKTFLKMAPDMKDYVFGNESSRYLREVVLALREVNSPLPYVCDMLLYCSYCNETFRTTLLKQLMLQYMNAPSNELKPVFNVLTDVLLLEDELQLKHLELIINGHVDDMGTQFEGLLAVVRLNHVQDSRRSYWCIKFLVNLANKCPMVKDYLQQTKSKWQWAVLWLKRKMTEYTQWSSNTTTVSNEEGLLHFTGRCIFNEKMTEYTQWSSNTTTVSNEDSNRKSFQRTVSAQDTLAEATALLTELENYTEMDTNGNNVTMATDEEETGNQSDVQMSSIEEEKGQKTDEKEN